MVNLILLYLASFFLVFWGAAHLFPTRSVVSGFGNISKDNQRIVAMEWINEGATLSFMGILVAAVTGSKDHELRAGCNNPFDRSGNDIDPLLGNEPADHPQQRHLGIGLESRRPLQVLFADGLSGEIVDGIVGR